MEIQPDDRHQIDMRGNFASLIMNDITADDDAEYSVTAVNKAGKATSKAELFVNPLSKSIHFISHMMQSVMLCLFCNKKNSKGGKMYYSHIIRYFDTFSSTRTQTSLFILSI